MENTLNLTVECDYLILSLAFYNPDSPPQKW